MQVVRVSSFEFIVPHSADDDTIQFDDGSLTGYEFDDTGHRLWSASLVLCKWLAANPQTVAGKRVLELGAGTALPSRLSARLGAAHCVATDMNGDVVEKLSSAAEPHLTASVLRWEDESRLSSMLVDEQIDTVIMCDVVYPGKDNTPLIDALYRVCEKRPMNLYFAFIRRDATLDRQFQEVLHQLPATCELLACERGENNDPLFGSATCSLYRLCSC